MDAGPIPLLKAMLPKVPLMGKTALYHTFGLSEHSEHWDLRTELTVRVLRSFVSDSPLSPLSQVQEFSIRDPGIKGRIWVSRYTTSKPPEDDVRQKLFKVIEDIKKAGESKGGFAEPELLPVEAEWTGYRAGATSKSPQLNISEEEKYTEMMREVTSPTTILYLHGGAYYLMDPATHRATTKKLAKLTKGRCLSVRYRLAPQGPFPCALLDAMVSYLGLLYPLEGAFHSAVDPRHIVFAGDSAGGNLCLVLLQTILEIRRQGLKIRWNGEDREVPLPAGVSTSSAWAGAIFPQHDSNIKCTELTELDITNSSPSCETNGAYDYLPARSVHPQGMEYLKCDIWPTTPPRRNLYAEDAMICHPLVSPITVNSWEGSCPLFMGTGQELLTDEDKYISAKAASQGVQVVYEQYEKMPHCFAQVFPELPAGRKFFDSWSKFISMVVERPEEVKTIGKIIQPKTLAEEIVDVKTVCDFTEEEVIGRMRERLQTMSMKQPETMSKL